MNAAVVVGGAAFIAGFLWREVLIGLPALRRSPALSPSDRSLIVGYYARVTRVAATRGVLAIAILAAGVALIAQLADNEAPMWAPVTCLALLVAVPVLSSTRTWPAARRLGSDRDHPDAQQRIARGLAHIQAAYVAMMTAIVGIQLTTIDGVVSAAITIGGAGFLAAVLWNEVLVDWPVAHISTEQYERYQPTVLGYYAVMTRTAVGANVASLTLTGGGAVAALVAQMLTADTPRWAIWSSLGLLAAILVLAGVRTWPGAVRIGRAEDGSEVQRRIGSSLSRFHLAFVAMLVATALIQVVALAR